MVELTSPTSFLALPKHGEIPKPYSGAMDNLSLPAFL